MRKKTVFSSFRNNLDESLINLTPLIDVVFVVLIAFIIIAPLLEVDRVELAAATPSSEKDISKVSRIAIYVREDDSVWINNRLVTDSELLSVLKESKSQNPKQIPQLYHDKKACFGTYQKVKSAAERAGFERIDVILKGG